MSREIEFIAWDKKSKKIRQVTGIAFNDFGEVKVVNMWGKDIIEDKRIIVQREPPYVELMQFTGLLDVNGKKIFEGDIVKCLINYGPGGDVERIVPIKITGFGINLQHWVFDNEWSKPEIVGNIYENTELLQVDLA